MKKLSFTSLGILALLINAPCFANGFGASGDTIPFFVNSGSTYIGTWTASGLNVTGGFTATGNAAINGSMRALYYDHASDIRLKTDIHPVENALERLLAIHGVEFRWRNSLRDDMGVIAQDVAQTFPNIVHTDASGLKSVEYDSLIAPVIEAIRELKSENDRLLGVVEKIQADIAGLKGGKQ
jgi:hypothetical protein